jgi:hypothetical protein
LAYSTQNSPQPPASWTSGWLSGTGLKTEYPIPSELLSVAPVPSSAAQPAQTTFQNVNSTWNPVRLPQSSQPNAPFALHYYLSANKNPMSTEPDITLQSTTPPPKAYTPQFYRAGVRWFYPGAAQWPHLWMQRWQAEDIPLSSQPPASSIDWKWVVYSRPVAASDPTPYNVIAFARADSTLGGADAPPGDPSWYAVEAPNSPIAFKPIRGDQSGGGAVAGVVTL